MTPRIAPFDGTLIRITDHDARPAFVKAFRSAQKRRFLRNADRLEYLGDGWYVTTLTPDVLALFCWRVGFKLSDMTADAASA
jgi:hypothetical protein